MIGKALGHYEILAELGEGGMGVVYKARDTHLDRLVAIKILPPEKLADPDRKRRFMHEARACSSLNHPNIVHVYDVSTIDGQAFIVMEYVAGRTLDDILRHRHLPWKKALKYASAITAGLSAAHSVGIVHRDLKPANVMITDHDHVKLLDFGLAKLTEPAGCDAFGETGSLVLDDSPRTEQGTIVGTVAYMSPEQAEGGQVDTRSDVFSFGALLYEMLSGNRAFTGDSKISVLTAILHKDPPALELPEGTPSGELRRLVGRCLKKDPDRRWQNAADLKLALDELREEGETGAFPLPQAPAPPRKLRFRLSWLWVVLLPVLSALAGLQIGRSLLTPDPPAYQRLTFRRGDILSARFAPGDTIAFTASWDGAPPLMFTTRPGSRTAAPLNLPVGRVLSVAPDGTLAVLVGQGDRGTLATVPWGGGTPREMLVDVYDADWSPDGKEMAIVRHVSGEYRVEYPIGRVIASTKYRPPRIVRVSPDGRMVAFFEIDTSVGDYSVVVASSSDDKRVLSSGWRAVGRLAWSPRGDEVWFSALPPGGELTVLAADLSGKVRTVASTTGWLLLHDTARDGRVLVTSVNARIRLFCRRPGQSSDEELSWLDSSYAADISADARMLLFIELSEGEGRNTAFYLRGTDGSPAVRLGEGNRQSLSPDGKWVLSIRRESDGTQLRIVPTGAGEAVNLSQAGMQYETAEWTPDGRHVLFFASENGRPPRTYLQPVDKGKPKAVTPEGIRGMRVAPDGRHLLSVEAGKLLLRPLGGGTPRQIAALEPTETIVRWSGEGHAVYLRRMQPGSGFMTLLRLDVETGSRRVLHEVHAPEAGGVFIGQVYMTPDGAGYAYSMQRDITSLYLVNGLQ